jgi:hypothetical protein
MAIYRCKGMGTLYEKELPLCEVDPPTYGACFLST